MCNFIKFMVCNIDTIRGTPRGLCEASAELANTRDAIYKVNIATGKLEEFGIGKQ
ncbi:MAG: hypothetical protein ACI8WT_004701 [Clostridium sp.]|jgi:hypothetical protein